MLKKNLRMVSTKVVKSTGSTANPIPPMRRAENDDFVCGQSGSRNNSMHLLPAMTHPEIR
jgi:hypothetical protein